MTMAVAADEHGHLTAAAEHLILPAAAKCSVVACGPGLGQSSGVTRVVIDLLARAAKPCVLDADGLNAVARTPESLRRRDPLIITPHPREFAPLPGISAAAVQADPQPQAGPFRGGPR